MIVALLLEVVLPIVLICWFAIAPARSLIGFLVQIVGTGLWFLALYIVGQWMMFPWWLPLAYALICITILAIRWPKISSFEAALPRKPAAIAGSIIMVSLASIAGYFVCLGLQGHKLPEARVVDLAPPLSSSKYLVVSGGSHELINGHMLTLNPDVERYRAYRGQSYGLDIIKINKLGLRSRGLQPRDPAAYAIFDEPVVAPCDGSVLASRSDRPDMPVPSMDLEVIEGNHVLLSCDDFVVLLAHFQQDSIEVTAGDQVSTGDYLGKVGNSGKTSEPHLHISAQLPGSELEPISGEPLAITIDGRYLVRNDVLRVAEH